MYLKIVNNVPVEWPIFEFQIRSMVYPETLPENLSEELVNSLGFEIYIREEKPEFDPRVQELIEGMPIPLEKGVWKSNWIIKELFSFEEKQKVLFNYESLLIRQQRNDLLIKSDWTQTTDWVPSFNFPKEKWAGYRQQLRDITKQESFPFNVVWPKEPRIEDVTNNTSNN